ncbi:hypothetical protein [Methylocaldum sp.]|uniref:hypothetical protein n=1 Tax=Methylocaldum sp. TaxID=1969727 RepID=UPI002D4C5E4C|nr:hypothetical protein [Methylocaldum sp.]HYE36445.1 hypothetical protein [Methylocaldum sp.]
MAAEIVTAVIAASGAVVLAGASYWFTKKRERDAELRKEKLDHYKDFVASLSSIISGEWTADGQRAFSRACNKLNLVAPQAVLQALQEFQQEIKISNTERSNERHDKLMSRLFYEIRKDLEVVPKDNEATFRIRLWASGVPPESPTNPSIERTPGADKPRRLG